MVHKMNLPNLVNLVDLVNLVSLYINVHFIHELMEMALNENISTIASCEVMRFNNSLV